MRYVVKLHEALAQGDTLPPRHGVHTDVLSVSGATMTQVLPPGIIPANRDLYEVMPTLYPRLLSKFKEKNLSKAQLEDLMRKYLGQHYCKFLISKIPSI